MVAEAAIRPLRFVVLGESIVSDWSNPVATSARAVLSSLAALGHEVTFLERRGNPALMSMLRARGSTAMRSFAVRYSTTRYRTYDLPRGWERTVWFAREVGTADVVIALPGTPPELIPEIVATPKVHVARFIDDSFEAEHDGFRLVRATSGMREGDIAFGAAVTTLPGKSDRSSRPLLVAYDDAETAREVASRVTELDPALISTGTAILDGWHYVSEVDLSDLYAGHRAAWVIGAGDSAWAHARELLPPASGCALLRPMADIASFDEETCRLSTSTPPRFDARVQAALIVSVARSALTR